MGGVWTNGESMTIVLETLAGFSLGAESIALFARAICVYQMCRNVTHHYTRMRAPYINRDGFRFKIYRDNGFAFLRRLFGIPDVEMGFVEFDEKYVIQGNDTGKLTALFSSATLREQLTADPSLWLEVKDDEGWFATKFPQGVDELYFCVGGIVKDIERLKGFFAVFTETLTQLHQIGSLEKGDPGVAL